MPPLMHFQVNTYAGLRERCMGAWDADSPHYQADFLRRCAAVEDFVGLVRVGSQEVTDEGFYQSACARSKDLARNAAFPCHGCCQRYAGYHRLWLESTIRTRMDMVAIMDLAGLSWCSSSVSSLESAAWCSLSRMSRRVLP